MKERLKEIKLILAEVMPDIRAEKVVVYAIDEVHLLEGDLISHLWGDSQERLNIPIMNGKNRQTYYGALNLSKNELIIQGYKAGNGDCTVDFLKKLIKANPAKKIIIFWDGVKDFTIALKQKSPKENLEII